MTFLNLSSSIFALLNPCTVQNPATSRIRILDLVPFWPLDPGSCQPWNRDERNRIRDKQPGSETLEPGDAIEARSVDIADYTEYRRTKIRRIVKNFWVSKTVLASLKILPRKKTFFFEIPRSGSNPSPDQTFDENTSVVKPADPQGIRIDFGGLDPEPSRRAKMTQK